MFTMDSFCFNLFYSFLKIKTSLFFTKLLKLNLVYKGDNLIVFQSKVYNILYKYSTKVYSILYKQLKIMYTILYIMDEIEILRILNKYNPWWNNKQIPESKRSEFKRGDFHIIKKELEEDREIISIVGPRRVGKTILIHQLIEHLITLGVEPKKILYLSVDEKELIRGEAGLKDILETYSKNIIKKPLDALEQTKYIFLDEIQDMPDWSDIIKNWYDIGYRLKFIISGSSSMWITKGVEESLLGRIKTHVVMPLKFSEVLRYRNIVDDDHYIKREELREAFKDSVKDEKPEKLYERIKELIAEKIDSKDTIEIELNRYLTIGGYPEFLEKDDYADISERTRNKIKLIFYKDIIRYFKVRNPQVLEDLFAMIAKSSGNQINIIDTAKDLDVQRPTIKNYIKYLKKAYLIGSSSFYSESRRKRVRKQEKIYVHDSGIRNAIVDHLDGDIIDYPGEFGLVVESVLFDHLIRLKYIFDRGPEPKIFYWKNKKEIDFIFEMKRNPIPIESKYRKEMDVKQIEQMKIFIKKMKSPFGIIITKDRVGLEDRIISIPLWAFLMIV